MTAFNYACFIPTRRTAEASKNISRASPDTAVGPLFSTFILALQQVSAKGGTGTTGPGCSLKPGRYGVNPSFFTPPTAYAFATAFAVSTVGSFGCSLQRALACVRMRVSLSFLIDMCDLNGVFYLAQFIKVAFLALLLATVLLGVASNHQVTFAHHACPPKPPFSRFNSRATHARTLQPAALAVY